MGWNSRGIPLQESFATVTIAGSGLACVLLIVSIALGIIWREHTRPAGRIILALKVANLVYSASWIAWSIGHLDRNEYILLRDHSLYNCATFGFNAAGLTAIVGAHSVLLATSLQMLIRRREFTVEIEAVLWVLMIMTSLGIGSGCGTGCSKFCGDCSEESCPERCTQIFEYFSYAWAGCLVFPVALGLAVRLYGTTLRRKSQKSGRHFELTLFQNLWRDVRGLPYMLIWLGAVYTLSAYSLAKVNGGAKTEAEASKWSYVLQSCWVLMATQSLLAGMLYFCSPRIASRMRPSALRKAWIQYRNGWAHGEPETFNERSHLLGGHDPGIQDKHIEPANWVDEDDWIHASEGLADDGIWGWAESDTPDIPSPRTAIPGTFRRDPQG